MAYIGIDLGTSAVKAILTDEDGRALATASAAYDVSYPRPGWSQQEPEDWVRGTVAAVREVLRGQDAGSVRGLAVAGQMHGLVALDRAGRVLRPAILWNDGRTAGETAWLNEHIGRERLTGYTANIAFAGFTAPKILWMRENEPELFSQIGHIMLPKDYLVYRLTGEISTDLSDASGTLLLDVEHRRWSREMLDICGVDSSWLPALHESAEAVGTLRPEMCAVLGLPGVTVAAGAGDNAAAAVGTGAVGEGGCNISLGTSGTVFISSESFRVDRHNALHAFAHADGGYHLMGCMLSAASCCGWWMEKVLGTGDFASEMAGMEGKLGRNTVFFLPYLMGERSPLNDVNARGAFIGLTPETGRRDMLQAVMEGVGFALRDSVEVARSLGVHIAVSRVSGGGAKNRLWLRMLADILNMRLQIPAVEEGPSYGAALLAAVACGRWSDVREASRRCAAIREEIAPEPELAEAYHEKYGKFGLLYPALKGAFGEIYGQMGA